MAKKSTGKRLRFSIFERDDFTCQYCGKHPPEVILHLDHIYPVSKGGKNEIENLITSCVDCNLGKSDRELGTAPKVVIQNSADLQERYDQLKAFYDLQKRLERIRGQMAKDISDHWNLLWPNQSLTNRGLTSLRKFLKDFSITEIKEAMEIAESKIDDSEGAFRYTCGILHTKKRQKLLDNSPDHG